MPSAADLDDDHDPAEAASGAPPTDGSRLLALQALDTEADQLGLRLERLDERVRRTERAAAVDDWERALEVGDRRIVELAAAIDEAERRGEQHDAQKQRFERQMKTVIAPREAEALTHEIDTLAAERDANETAELVALEEQSSLEDGLVAHRAAEQGLRDALVEADRVLAASLSEIAAAQEIVATRRGEARAALDEVTLRTYDRIRAHLGVAVAPLEGKMCGGCHLDLSAAEVDTVRETATAGGGLSDCPQCGRILVA